MKWNTIFLGGNLSPDDAKRIYSLYFRVAFHCARSSSLSFFALEQSPPFTWITSLSVSTSISVSNPFSFTPLEISLPTASIGSPLVDLILDEVELGSRRQVG